VMCTKELVYSTPALSNAAPAGALAPTIYFSGALRKDIEPIININSNFKTKNTLECLSTVKYEYIHIIIISSSRSSTY
jgi:hypothetical protein